MKHRATTVSRRTTRPGGTHRAPRALATGAHRAPVLLSGSHRAPIGTVQVGHTATAAVFGVTAAALALGSAASGHAGNHDEPPQPDPLRDTASHDLKELNGLLAGRAQDAATRSGDDIPATTATTRPTKPTTKLEAAQRAVSAAAQSGHPRKVRAVLPRSRFSSPMPGAAVTSCFGMRWGALHAGIDFAKPIGTPEHAVQAGRVVAAGWNYGGYGISVMVDHGNGFLTHYAHMRKAAVHVGQQVRAGDILGYEGSTGDSTGPHLHFEVHQGMWNQVNPVGWLRARGIRVAC